MKKRIVSLLLTVAMVFSLMSTSAVFAVDENIAVIVGDTVEAPLVVGETVSVPVVITQNPGMTVARVEVTWDDSALELTSVTYGQMGDKGSAPINEITDGKYSVSLGSYTATENYTDINEALFTLNFKILSGAEEKEYDISLAEDDGSFLNVNTEEIQTSFTNASVKLSEPVHSLLQQIPAGAYSDTNLWAELTPDNGYYKGATWNTKYKSITIPVTKDDKIYASSFQEKSVTGGTSDGICVVYFYGNTVVDILNPSDTYAAYTATGYITVPAGVNAVSIPMWKDDANAVVNLKNLPARPVVVAKIGEVGYESLAEAVAAAGENDIVVLNKDITLTEAIEISGKKVTVDLNEKTIDSTVTVFNVKNGGELNLSNGTINATGDNSIVVWSHGAASVANKINLNDVTLSADTFVIYHNGLKYGADVSIKDSTLTSAESVAVYLAGRATVDSNWAEGKNNTLVIDGSTITGVSAVEVKRTEVTVKEGSELTASEAEATMNGNTNGPASSGYALALTSNKGIAVGSATVTGGTFNGKIGIEVTEGITNTAEFAVSGGTFDEAVNAEYCADGFEPKDNGDGTFGVAPEAPAILLGDVDLDGDVDMDDFVAVMRHALYAEVITDATALAAAEVTGDDSLDMDDAAKIMKYALKAIDSLE